MNVILACGYLGFRSIPSITGPIEYFNGVAEYLRENYPVKVVATMVDPTRGVIYRGDQLRRQILIALGDIAPETKEEHDIAAGLDRDAPVHVIAHSMGSLDSRYVLSPGNPTNLGGRVTTLSTIGGPHRGSPTAALLFKDVEGVGSNELEQKAAAELRDLMGRFGISLDGLRDLTPEACEKFDQQYPNHPDVQYFSVAGGGWSEDRPTCLALRWSWKYITEVTGEVNDGAVNVSSAQWGTFDPNLWPADHPGLIGHDVDRCGRAPKHWDYLASYGALVQQVLDLGEP